MDKAELTAIEAKQELHRRLRQAVHHERLDEIVSLLEQGADVNAPNSRNVTTIAFAVKFGKYASAQLLLERGADANAADDDGRRPMDFAKSREMIELLLAYHGDCSWGTVPAGWLDDRISAEQFGALETAFSGWNRWECFKAYIQPDDEVWSCKPNQSLSGRSGFAIVREGKVVRALITELS